MLKFFATIEEFAKSLDAKREFCSAQSIMYQDKHAFLMLATPPGRLTIPETAWLLGFAEHDIPVLVSVGLLKPLGSPASTGSKYFAAVEIQKLRNDTRWLSKASDAIVKHWKTKNADEPAETSNQSANQRHMNQKEEIHTFQKGEGMSDFIFDDHPVRMSGTPERPLFVAKDVCAALGIENHRDLLAKSIPEDEKGVERIYSLGGPQEMVMVTEPGLYRLIFRSDKPEAKRFQDWVFKELLPQIRRMTQNDWLKKAFAQGKTGRVQLEILQEMGIGAERAVPNKLARSGFSASKLLDLQQFWAAVDQGYAAKPRPEAFRLRQHEDSWLVYLLPIAVLELAREAADEWRNVSREHLRAQLELQPEWVRGEFRQRFGRRAKAASCCWAWALAVTKDSPEGLRQLIDQLMASPEREQLIDLAGSSQQ